MGRLSMKKFKFHTTTDVFMQCKLRACAAQPCGTCQRRRLSQDPDLSPVEGEMYSPIFKIKVSKHDKNALVFGAVVDNNPAPIPTNTPQQNAISNINQLIFLIMKIQDLL